MKFKRLLISLTALGSASAFAHEGAHSKELMTNIWHLFTQPSHALTLVVLVAVITWAIVVVRARSSLKNSEPNQ